MQQRFIEADDSLLLYTAFRSEACDERDSGKGSLATSRRATEIAHRFRAAAHRLVKPRRVTQRWVERPTSVCLAQAGLLLDFGVILTVVDK